jgi:hypothetical protein
VSDLDDKLRKTITEIISNGISEYRPEGKPIEEITDAVLKAVADAGIAE